LHRRVERRRAATETRIISRKARKARKGKTLSFRTKREIFPRSLAFARDDRPWARHLASLRLCGRHIRIRESSITGKFTQAARDDKHVGLCFRIAIQRTVFNQETLPTLRTQRLCGEIMIASLVAAQPRRGLRGKICFFYFWRYRGAVADGADSSTSA